MTQSTYRVLQFVPGTWFSLLGFECLSIESVHTPDCLHLDCACTKEVKADAHPSMHAFVSIPVSETGPGMPLYGRFCPGVLCTMQVNVSYSFRGSRPLTQPLLFSSP